jgi:hypothetical protein
MVATIGIFEQLSDRVNLNARLVMLTLIHHVDPLYFNTCRHTASSGTGDRILEHGAMIHHLSPTDGAKMSVAVVTVS